MTLALVALVVLPFCAGLMALVVPRGRHQILVGTATLHALLAFGLVISGARPQLLHGWLMLDGPGSLVLLATAVVFLAAALGASGYLKRQPPEAHHTPEPTFIGSMLFFLGTATLMAVAHNFGVMWVALEASTLATAPLIYFHRDARSLEATWKYLLVCSVGLALALMGNFLLAIAAQHPQLPHGSLDLPALVGLGPTLAGPWLQAAFVFLLVGYGTKMGLVPLHTWLPDAHSEAPSVVSALLSGALLNCAFLAILRAQEVMTAAGEAAFTAPLLRGFGLLSMAIAAVFIYRQRDYKRMLAYSSVEHMGLLALGAGLGPVGAVATLAHALNHSLAKASLFLTAGDILETHGSKQTREVRGLLASRPLTGALWLAGLFAITGLPPFATFNSELGLLRALFQGHHTLEALAVLLILAVVFAAMSALMLPMAHGEGACLLPRPRARMTVPLTLSVALVVLGLFPPPAFTAWLHAAARTLGGP